MPPPSPGEVNCSPRSANVTRPRSIIRQRRVVDPFEGQVIDQFFVYEMSPREVGPTLADNIHPTAVRAKHYPGGDTSRPHLDSFWSYLYHCVVDPCCGDLEQHVYNKVHGSTAAGGLMSQEEVMFFGEEDDDYDYDYDYGDNDDDDDENGNDSMEAQNKNYSFDEQDNQSSFASRSMSFMKGRSFRNALFSESMAEI